MSIEDLQELAKSRVYIGFPQDGKPRGGEITNAELAHIHTNGSPARNIPARPFLQPAIEKNAKQIAKLQAAAITAALLGEDVKPHLEAIGQYAASAAKRFLGASDNGLASNKPATIARKGSSKPLIDTGKLRAAITYVVEQ